MKNFKKHWLIAAIIIILGIIIGYIYPFMLANNVPGNDVAVEQYILVVIFFLPVVALFLKKPQSLWVYSYPILWTASLILAFTSGDALGAGLMILFIALPLSIIYTILVFIKTIK